MPAPQPGSGGVGKARARAKTAVRARRAECTTLVRKYSQPPRQPARARRAVGRQVWVKETGREAAA